jgi:hypothetical protein
MKTHFKSLLFFLFSIGIISCTKPETSIAPATGSKAATSENLSTIVAGPSIGPCMKNVPIKLLTIDALPPNNPLGISLSGAVNNALTGPSTAFAPISGITSTDLVAMTTESTQIGACNLYIVNKNGTIRRYIYTTSANFWQLTGPVTVPTSAQTPIFISSDRYVFPMGKNFVCTIGTSFCPTKHFSIRFAQIDYSSNLYEYTNPNTANMPIVISDKDVRDLLNSTTVKFVLQSPNYTFNAWGIGKIIVIKTNGEITELVPDASNSYHLNPTSLGTIPNIATVSAVSANFSQPGLMVARTDNVVWQYNFQNGALNNNPQYVGSISLGKTPCTLTVGTSPL